MSPISSKEPVRAAVELGKDDIHRDRGSAGCRKPIQEFCKHRSRPRPLVETRKRRIIDVDDPHRSLVIVCTRFQPLVSVEHNKRMCWSGSGSQTRGDRRHSLRSFRGDPPLLCSTLTSG